MAPSRERLDGGAAHHPPLVAAGGARCVEDARHLGRRRRAASPTPGPRPARSRAHSSMARPRPTGPIGWMSIVPPSRRVASRYPAAKRSSTIAAAHRSPCGSRHCARPARRVDGHVGAAGTQCTQHRGDRVARAACVDADAATRLNPELPQSTGDAIGEAIELGVRDPSAPGFDDGGPIVQRTQRAERRKRLTREPAICAGHPVQPVESAARPTRSRTSSTAGRCCPCERRRSRPDRGSARTCPR